MAKRTRAQRDRAKEAGTATTPAPSKRRYRRRLSTLQNVRTGLADVIRELEEGTRDVNAARALTYGYSILSDVIQTQREQEDVAEELTALTARLDALEHVVERSRELRPRLRTILTDSELPAQAG